MSQSQDRTLRQRLSNTFNSIFRPNQSSDPIISGVSQNQLFGAGLQALNPSQSTAVNEAMTNARTDQSNTPTGLERFSSSVGSAITSLPQNIASGIKEASGSTTDYFRNLYSEETRAQNAAMRAEIASGNTAGFSLGPVVNASSNTPSNIVSERFKTDFSLGERPVIDYEGQEQNFGREVGTFSAATNEMVDREFNKFLTSAGFKKNEEGKFILDSEIFGEQRDLLGKTFEELKEQYKTDYDRIKEDLETREAKVDRGFRQSQQALSEQAFLGQRQMQAALAGRGLGGSGIAQLGGVQQQIARGQQMSNLAAEYTELQRSIMTEGTRASETLSSKLEQADLQLAQGIISIADKQRQEETAFNQYLAETKMNLREAIDSRNFREFSAQVARYEAATQASAAELNKRITLANMDLSNLYDDFSSRMEQLQDIMVAKDGGNKKDKEEYNRLASQLRAQYEEQRNTIVSQYGLRG
jgi:hypothetical protein